MSLHKFAEQVAAQGRGDDSLLVHMTPDEVQRLQAFAEANGTTMTINPETGLPEAGFLSDLFKAVAPIALGAFLGPAGLGMSSMMAGVATGGITTLATGSLSRGLMAGLGAYGGAGLGSSLMGASGMTGGAALGAGMPADMGFNLADAGVESMANVDATSKAIAQAQPTAFDKVAAGAKAVTASPGAALDFAKGNLGNLAYAAAPIAAGMMVPTTTKLGDPKDTGYIRQFDYNINPETGRPDPLYGMRAMTPVKASEFGNKTFQGQRDLFRQQNPNPYQNPYELGVGSLNQPPQQQQQPTPMAGGGIVALAGGGNVKHFAIGDLVKADIDKAYAAGDYARVNELAQANKITAADVADTYKGFDTSGLAGLGVNLYTPPAAPTYTQYTPEQMGSFLSNPVNKDIDLGKAIKDTNADPAAVNAYIASLTKPFVGSTESDRGSGTFGIYNQMVDKSISPDEYYAAAIANDPKYAGWTKDMIQEGYNLNKGMYALSDAKKGVVTDTDWAKLMVGNGTWDNPQYDPNEMAQATGLSIAEVRARYELEKLKAKTETKTETKLNCPAGYRPNAAGTACELIPIIKDLPPPPDPFVNVTPTGFYGNDTGNPLTRTPGDITTNKDGTVTVTPNIPGRPDGGFTGMGQVKDAYTAGGGSLGYTASVPKTAAEHNALYNKLTDDSLDAYNFLMGKGKNLTQRKAETRDRPVMQRYDEAILGRKIPKLTRPGTTTTKTVTGVPGKPQTYFDEAAYLAANPDVAAELKTGKSVSGEPTRFTSGYEHYLMYGKSGGRAFTGDYEGYLTAAALADAANASGGGDAASPSGGNNSNTISGFNPAAPDPSIAESFGLSPDSTDGNTGSTTGTEGGAVASANGGLLPRGYAMGGGLGSLGSYSDGGRLLRGPGDGVSDSIPATIGRKQQPARLADGEFVIPARIVSELGNGSTDAGAKKLYAMMARVQRARGKTTGKNKVAANSRADKYLPA